MSYKVSAVDLSQITLNETDHVRSILQNVAMILSTRAGTVPLYREFGLSQEFVHKPILAARTLLVAEVKEAIETFEPRVEVEDISFETDSDSPEKLTPTVEVNIIE